MHDTERFITTLLRTRAKSLGRSVNALLDDPVINEAFFKGGLMRSMGISTSGGGAPKMSSYLSGRTFSDALLGALVPGTAIPGIAEVKQRLSGLTDSRLKDALTALVTTAEAEGTSIRDDVARWFDDAMERLSGNYVRYMKYFSLALGFVVALSLNVDTIQLATRTWTDRAQFVVPEVVTTGIAAACREGDNAAQLSCRTTEMAKLVEQMKVLPIGWTNNVPTNWLSFDWLLLKLFGLLLTALAISVGAPFWFDILQLVMNLRGTGTKPAQTSPPGTLPVHLLPTPIPPEK